MAKEEEEKKSCPECGGRLYRDYARGELICGSCGLVINEKQIDQGPEWRAFDSQQSSERARTGAPMNPLLHDKGLSTEIGWKDRDASGSYLPMKKRSQMYRLRQWQRRIRVSGATERNKMLAFQEIGRVAARLELPEHVKEDASQIYTRTAEKNLIRGRSIESVAAASLYAACRVNHLPRTLDEIAAESTVHRKHIGRTYRFLMRELKMTLRPTSPVDYIPRFCGMLALTRKVELKAIDIIDRAIKSELTSGRGPTGVAASAIYIASTLIGERRTQREIAEITGVTEVTIRNRYKEMVDRLGLHDEMDAATGEKSTGEPGREIIGPDIASKHSIGSGEDR